MRTTITARAGSRPDGTPVYENVLVEPLENERYRVIATPALVLGTAANDIVHLDQELVTVDERGGRLALHVYGRHATADELTIPLRDLGGSLDSRAAELTVFSVPLAVGFERIEAVLSTFVSRHPDVECVYTNVYEEDGVTPLDWWQVQPRERRSRLPWKQ